MILPLIQVMVTAALLVYAGIWRRQQVRRKARSWDELVAQLRANDWGFDDIADRYLYKGGIHATPHDIWSRIDGARGLWAMFVNARILVQLADYAATHGETPDEELLESLRSDAFQIRLCVLLALGKYAASRSTVGASVNAHRAAGLYSEMLARLTHLLQEHAAQFFPRYLEAM